MCVLTAASLWIVTVSVAAQEVSELDVSLLRSLKREFGFYCIELMAEPEEVVFFVGGENVELKAIFKLERYDNVTGKWQKGAPMMTARSSSGLCGVGGLLYAAGGLDAEGDGLASVECYDPILDTWSVAPALPQSRYGHGVYAVGDSLYILGGVEDVVGRRALATRNLLKFDSSTQAWSKVAPMPEARSSFVACVLNNAIHVIGGCANATRKTPISATTR
jgi:N-acetylneuraminic acid mutarotase